MRIYIVTANAGDRNDYSDFYIPDGHRPPFSWWTMAEYLVYYQCFIEPDDSCSETDKLLHLKVRIKPDVAHNGRIARLYPEESEQAAIDDANRAIGRLRTILGRC